MLVSMRTRNGEEEELHLPTCRSAYHWSNVTCVDSHAHALLQMCALCRMHLNYDFFSRSSLKIFLAKDVVSQLKPSEAKFVLWAKVCVVLFEGSCLLHLWVKLDLYKSVEL